MPLPGPALEDVERARERTRTFAHHTPLIPSFALSSHTDREIRLKLESVQDTRSFKVRGAANAILAKRANLASETVVTYSTGNHGRATAYVASRLGLSTIVCLSHNTTEDKRNALVSMGAELRLVGDSQDQARELALELSCQGPVLIDPINDPDVTAGHGTIGLELFEDWPDLDTVVVPVSGGALIAGIAVAIKAVAPQVRLVGVSMENGAAMHESLVRGEPTIVLEHESLADSLQGGVTLDNTHTFEIVRELVDELLLVSEEEIAMGMTEALVEESLVVEGAGATPMAALLHRAGDDFGRRVALVVTGGVVEATRLCDLARSHRAPLAELLGGGR